MKAELVNMISCPMMNKWRRTARSLLPVILLSALLTTAATKYVDINNASPSAPYETWASAATNIQEAIDVCALYDTVIVSNGVYDTGGRVVSVHTNRVYVDNRVTLIAAGTNPADTVIVGAPDPTTGSNGTAAIRCVYLGVVATISGFTLTNGYAGPLDNADGYGGGLYCDYNSVMASDCVITGCGAVRGGGVLGGKIYNCGIIGNRASDRAGGVMQVQTLQNSLIAGNTAPRAGGTMLTPLYGCTVSNNSAVSGSADGGGVEYGSATNCLIIDNYALDEGGGAANASLDYCTVLGNVASDMGGGVSRCNLKNCLVAENMAENRCGGTYLGSGLNSTIVFNSATNQEGGVGGSLAAFTNCIMYYNYAPSEPNVADDVTNLAYCCTPVTNGLSGPGNIDSEPMFVDTNSSNYRLTSGSPCVNAGLNLAWMTNAVDLDGEPRLDKWDSVVDMGAYEFMTRGTVIFSF